MMKEYIVVGIALVSFIVGCGSGAKSEEDTNTAPVAKSLRVDVQKNNKKIIEQSSDSIALDKILQNATVRSNVRTHILLEGVDAEDDNLTYRIISNPTHGILRGKAPHLIYTSDKNFFGKDTFTYKVNDGKKDSALATVEINVRLYKLLTRMDLDENYQSHRSINFSYYDNGLIRSDPMTGYEYNAQNELVTELNLDGGGTGEKTIYTYDKNHQVVSSRDYGTDGELYTNNMSYDNNNTYDSHENLIRMERRLVGHTDIEELFLFTYDANNSLLTSRELTFDADGNVRDTIEIKYNNHGDEIAYTRFENAMVTYRGIKTYTTEGYLTLALNTFENYEYRDRYERFDNYGNPTTRHYTKISQDVNPVVDVNETWHYTYGYDTQGNILTKTSFLNGLWNNGVEYIWREFQ